MCVNLAAFAESRNITMFVTADNHFGFDSATTDINRANIQAMNSLPGTAYPSNIGGTVGTPSGVIVAGDLTQDGQPDEWDKFEDHYPLYGGTGTNEIRYPVYECTGNHDRHELSLWDQLAGAKTVKEEVADRHGDQKYGFEIQGVQFYSLDQYPTESKCEWLTEELALVGTEKPVVLFFHFDMWDDEWWSPAERENFRQTINGYNILGIVHGHKHDSFVYNWNGYDVFSPGSAKSEADDHSVGVLNITDKKLTWAEYDLYDSSGTTMVGGHWEDTFVKTIGDPDPLVHYTFKETSPGTWEVFVEVNGVATAGLSAYEVWVDGVDPELVSFEQNTLFTVTGENYFPVGFLLNNLTQGEVDGSFNAGNFQNAGDAAILGIGMQEVDEAGTIPGDTPHVDLDVPALLGILSTPAGLTEENFRAIVVGLLNKTGDGFLDATDIIPTYEVIPCILLRGDANHDGVVSAADYACVQANFGNVGNGILGDANQDGVVSAADYSSVQANFGRTSASAVPEPATLAMLAASGVALIRKRK